MKTLSVLIFALLASLGRASISDMLQMRPQFGDARNAYQRDGIAWPTNAVSEFSVELPTGEYHAITVSYWVRFMGSSNQYQTACMETRSSYCPEPVINSGPDISSGAFGFPTGTNISGSASCAYAFAPESNVPSNVFARGAYTIAGWSSNTITVTLGGSDVVLGPGAFNRNALPGPSDGIIVSGSGSVCVGIAKMHAHQFFGGFDFAASSVGNNYGRGVSNELAFVAVRIRLDDAQHIYRCDIYGPDYSALATYVETNRLPNNPTCRALSSRGMYRFGLGGFSNLPTFSWDIFDPRVQLKWVSDDDIDRIYRNGAEEIGRRGIPRWK